MHLDRSPFILLDVSVRDNQSVISEQFEEKNLEGEISENDLMLAQQKLMAPKTRLEAELSYLPNINPKKSEEIIEFIKGKNYEKLGECLNMLSGLARANVASFLCIEKKGNDEILNHIFQAYFETDEKISLSDINGNRSVAGFPAVDEEMMSEYFSKVSESHAEAVICFFQSAKHPGKSFTGIVEKYIGSEEVAYFIDKIASKYSALVMPKIREYEEQIDKTSEEIKKGNNLEEQIEKIISLLKTWDEYSQPLQLINQAKGFDEKRSQELYKDMRSISLWLVNEKNKPKLSLKFAMSLGEIFPELPSVALEIERDIEQLQELIGDAKEFVDCMGLIIKIIEASKKHEAVCELIVDGNFRADGKGIAGDIYREFVTAIKESDGGDYEHVPWNAVISFAIKLNNEFDSSQAAKTILETILLFTPPQSIENVIKRNLSTIKRNAGEGDGLNILKYKLFIFIAIVIIGLLLGAAKDNNSSTAPTPKYKTEASSDIGIEIIPEISTSRTFKRSELRYCQFQYNRLDYMKPLLTNSMIDRYNALVDDWNLRCSSYRYRKNDMQAVKQELTTKRDSLQKEAENVIKSWRYN